MQAVGQRGEALHMAQSQQAAEEAVQGGLVLALLLELLSQLEEALPPPVQHPQSQPETRQPPIRAPPAEDQSPPSASLLRLPPLCSGTTGRERLGAASQRSEPASTHTHMNTRAEAAKVPPWRREGERQSFRPGKSRTGGERQAEAAPSTGA